MAPFLPFLFLTLPNNHSHVVPQNCSRQNLHLREEVPPWKHSDLDLTTITKRYSPSSDLLQVRPSEACGGGLGVFCHTEIAPNTIIAEIPVSECVTVHTDVGEGDVDNRYPKLERILKEFLEEGNNDDQQHAAVSPLSREGIVVSIKLLLIKELSIGNAANADEHHKPLHAYVASLPWDAMQQHPLLDDNVQQNPGPVWRKARRDAKIAESLLQRAGIDTLVSLSSSSSSPLSTALFQECLTSLALVQSRAFQLSKASSSSHLQQQHQQQQRSLPHCAMVPLLDLFNHPSKTALQFYNDNLFLELPISQATLSWTLVEQQVDDDADNNNNNDDDSISPPLIVQVRSPKGIHLEPGSEIWNWYGDGGYVSDPKKRQQGMLWDYDANRDFIEMYGFDPWV